MPYQGEHTHAVGKTLHLEIEGFQSVLSNLQEKEGLICYKGLLKDIFV